MLEEVMSQAFWLGLLKIIGVNVILSGDNAVVIALAARSLPAKQQKQAIIWGSAAAIVMRVILTLFAVALLTLPWLKLATPGRALPKMPHFSNLLPIFTPPTTSVMLPSFWH